MLDKQIISSSFFYTISKYLILVLGFVRATFVALILSKNDMGELALIYLILEYSSYLFSLGLPNSINLQASIDKNYINNLNHNNQKIQKYYSIFFFILIVVCLVFYSLFFLSTNFYGEFYKEIILNNYNEIFLIILLYSIKSFCNMHNRLWENSFRLMLSDITYSLLYLMGIIFLLDYNSDDPINIILQVIIFSQVCSIIVSNLKISSKHFISFDKKHLKQLLPIGVLLMIQNMMELYFWGIDRLFISFYLIPENLALFHIAHTYGRGMMMFFAALTFLIYPRLITILSNEKISIRETKRVIDKAFSISETILVLAFGFYITFIPYLMNLILKKYDNFFYIFSLILIGLIIKNLTFFPVTFLISRRKQKKLILSSLIFLIILVFLYQLLFKFELISNAEHFTSVAVIIFLFFSIYIFSWSMLMLKQKKIYLLVINKFWRILSLLLVFFYCYNSNFDQMITIFIMIFSIIFIYFKSVLNSSKIIYSTISNIYLKNINKKI